MIIRVSDALLVRNPTDDIKNFCKSKLVLDNPDYYKKERLGKWTGDTPKKITLFSVHGNEIWLPFGCLQEIWKLHPIKTDYIYDIPGITHISYESAIQLYSYQEMAVQAALQAKNGVLVMPCGSGKTQCGLEIIARIGGRALWLTHTQDLLNQSKARAENVLVQGGYGTITAGRVNIGTHITFATVQTMAKLDLVQLRKSFDVIIVDEAQHCAGSPTRVTQFYKVVSSLAARYKIGLTATPKRADGLEGAMFAILGRKIYEVSREEVAHTTCPVKVKAIQTGWIPDYACVLMGDGTIDYSKVIENMIHNEERYSIIFGEILSKCHGPTMILANRVEYLERICEDLIGCGKRAICLSGKGQSKKAKEERKKALEMLNSGQMDFILATYALAKEGLDVPSLRYVVFATPEQDETTVIQSVGRVGRKAEGKECGTVFDFVDDFGMYRGWYTKRKRHYKKIGVEIVAE